MEWFHKSLSMKIQFLKYLPCVLLTACMSPEFGSLENISDDAVPICIRSEINQVYTRRVDDGGFADGDAIGVYLVNYENDQPGALTPDANYATNVKFTFDEGAYKWNSDKPVYWKDKVTPVDAYGYYPYREEIPDVNAMPFSVISNQSETDKESGLGGYEASDLLWAKASEVSPSMGRIDLEHNHIMASIMVTLVPGEGFTAEEWAALDKTVMVENTHLGSYVDLSNGNVVVDDSSSPQSIVAVRDGQDWRAVVVPQIVNQDISLISITINGYSFYWKRNEKMTFHQGKMHKFTIEVANSIPGGDYRFTLLDESITAWENDVLSHGGRAKEYLMVHVQEAGKLQEVLEELDIDVSQITNLKISGQLKAEDCYYIRRNIRYIESINLYEARFVEDKIPDNGFAALPCLTSFVFPKILKEIGPSAFKECAILGDLIIPEGVTHIHYNAFALGAYNSGESDPGIGSLENGLIDNSLFGTLVLPSTLEYIGESAFRGCKFNCELILPENLKKIERCAFDGCCNFYGKLILPEGLTEIPTELFRGTEKISGAVTIPQGVTEIGESAFANSGISGVIFPSTVNNIESCAFENSKLSGELILPESLYGIGSRAFAGTSIMYVEFPEYLTFMDSYAFSDCSELQDTLCIPEKLERIPRSAFSRCSMLEAIVLPSGLALIEDEAFKDCYSLSYIHSAAEVPPTIINNTVFAGVAKDNFTVEVKDEYVSVYRTTDYWREFKRIAAYKGFVSRPSFANVLNAGGYRELILNAPSGTDWFVAYCPDWCHLSAESGTGKTELTLTIDPMDKGNGDRTDRIVLKLDSDEEYLTYIDIGQYDYEYAEDEYVAIQKAEKGTGIDIFIVGDGYDAKDISSGLYLEDMRQEMEYFFAVEPYKTYRDYFDVHTAIALSNESGIGTLNTLRDVKFETTYGDFANARINGNAEAVVEYAVETVDEITSDNIHRLTAVVIPNSDAYDGVTNMWTNGTAVAFCPKSSAEYPNDARGLIQHEAGGHAFGKLGDEYIYHRAFIHTCKCHCCEHVDGIKEAHSHGWYRNLSLNGKYSEIGWSHLIFDPRYSDIVDVYEGGYFHSRGVFRSEFNSCMNNNVPYFSTISRQAIVERIIEYAGEEFSFEDFIANDSREWGIDFTESAQTRSTAVPDYSIHEHRYHPIIIEGSPLD